MATEVNNIKDSKLDKNYKISEEFRKHLADKQVTIGRLLSTKAVIIFPDAQQQ